MRRSCLTALLEQSGDIDLEIANILENDYQNCANVNKHCEEGKTVEDLLTPEFKECFPG